MGRQRSGWPVLTSYDADHLHRIALPLGGIGTGTVSLGGRGDLRDWEIVNRPAKGFAPEKTFFALHVRDAAGRSVTRALEGAVPATEYEGASGCIARNHGLPRFRHASFDAAYPFGQVHLQDPDVPVTVRLEAFNPLVPGDAELSGIPVAVLRFVLRNRSNRAVTASVCGTLTNFIGSDGTNGKASRNVNVFRTSADGSVCGLSMQSEGVARNAEQWGTLALATTVRSGVSHRTAWARRTWGNSLLDFWDDFSADGRLEERAAEGVDAPQGSLAVAVKIPARGERAVTFLLAWHFPNRMTWTPAEAASSACDCADPAACADPNRVGNHYTTRYADAWDVAVRTAADLPRLERQTLAFVRSFCDSDLPAVVREAALYNLSTLRTQTCFRTEDGHFFGWEGCNDKSGCCTGSCTHVWNYEHATGFLFGSLARSMREVEFLHSTSDQGFMAFRVNLPLARALEWGTAAADGQMGTLMRLYRDWQLSGDDAFLRRLWPTARRALEFCWIPGGWDADRDGVMEGCQHNTMDVEYYGPNPQMTGWYLGALRACEEMARRVGEDEFAATCRRLFDSGSAWMDAHLFNGEYYEHEIRPPASEASVAAGLRHPSMGARDVSQPVLQLGAGCLVDQLVGQYTAHVCGLGYLHSPESVRATLKAIVRYNGRGDFHGHFNHLRSYVMNDEAALLMATYPRGRRPAEPFPYYNEVMTGFEYVAAVGLLYEGRTEEGLKAIGDIRGRYDGRKRSPFDEAECGHHYARAMAAWSAVLALTGFHWSGVSGTMTFSMAPRTARWFWSNGSAWGTCAQRGRAGGRDIELTVLHGELSLSRFVLAGHGEKEFRGPQRLRAGKKLRFRVHLTVRVNRPAAEATTKSAKNAK